MPNIGAGALKIRDSSKVFFFELIFYLIQIKLKSAKLVFTPQMDYYRTLALECTGKQIAIDLFAIGCKNMDLLTLG